jgi:hypothetical protein
MAMAIDGLAVLFLLVCGLRLLLYRVSARWRSAAPILSFAPSPTGGFIPRSTTDNRHVFVSYSSKDESRVAALIADAEARGLKCWMAPRDLTPGRNYQDEIVRAIESADRVLVSFWQAAQSSQHVAREVSVAQDLRKRVVPVRLDETQPQGRFKYMLSNLHWVDCRGGKCLPVDLS